MRRILICNLRYLISIKILSSFFRAESLRNGIVALVGLCYTIFGGTK